MKRKCVAAIMIIGCALFVPQNRLYSAGTAKKIEVAKPAGEFLFLYVSNRLIER